MKRSFRLSPEAARDIREIWEYISVDSLRSARKVRLLILDACRSLAMNPGMGHPRGDLTRKPVLFWPVGSCLIVYDPVPKPIQIVRVLHAARDVKILI